ncbi:MAG: response regulator transcription factor [Candidatus Bipolaricaulota bacterium]|nr:response regulator transcription factor [Candidatus Bipolaricaulota bacterium]MCS7274329.1 response regulator transcription factor [Candidatus Bipolaricaulota bacterium]MDW8110834.1 response regulator transcription factor [Candidatus Bipolaricaulota bacterium]MDW8328685.1 response regulator transcription factor [Candidatus Bipolaricaulota bacterium]
MRILIAEDDANSLHLLKKYLESKGHHVIGALNGQEALEKCTQEKPDVLLLDVMMPKLDGWTVLQRLRESNIKIPVIMVTAKDSTDDKVRGFSTGADDYITKPFDLREVEARLEAVMRRVSQSPYMQVGALQIDDERKEVRLYGQTIELSPKEYDLLKLLASRPGKVFSHREIIDAIWQDNPYASSEDVKKYIYLLRNKLEKDAEDPKIILTVRGFGYKLGLV